MDIRKVISLVLSAVVLFACINDGPETGADLKVGDRIPDFSITMNDGSIVTGAGLRQSVSVIVFFHTSCPDCRKTLPVLQKIYDEYASRGVRFALISRAEAQDSVSSFWQEQGLTMPFSAQNDRKIYEMFAASLVPRIYICRNGIIEYIFTDDPVPSYDDLNLALVKSEKKQ